MRTLTKAFMATLVVAVSLSMWISQASARNLRVSSQLFEVIFAPLEFTGGLSTARCNFTLLGEFHSTTIPKVLHSLVGIINHVRPAAPCAAGAVTVLEESLPWHLTYEGFEGTLPRITGFTLLLIGAALNVREPTFGVACLFRTTIANPSRAIATRNTTTGAITGIRPSGTIPGSCGVNGSLTAPPPGSFTQLDERTPITVTLI